MENTGTNDNIVEDNTVIGNTNGLFMTAGVQGNIIRRNLLEGNPPMQVSVDHTANIGFDIKNLADAGANTFLGNICVTSLNAPCPSVGPTLTASPNPIPLTGGAIHGSTTISWNAPGAEVVEIRIGSPDGKAFTRMGYRGSIQTGAWVADGMTFYLQDVTGERPLTSDYTLATLVVHLQSGTAANLHLRNGPPPWASGAAAVLLGLVLCGVVLWESGSRGTSLRIALRGAGLLALVAGTGLSQTSAKLDQMIAAGASPQQLAQYVFDTHGCRKCHTIGQGGRLGYTTRGKEMAQGFEGCISTLKAMSMIANVPEGQRSATQRLRAQRFEEFGCATCHKVTPGKMQLTAMGAKLSHLHLGCVEVEKLVAATPASQR